VKARGLPLGFDGHEETGKRKRKNEAGGSTVCFGRIMVGRIIFWVRKTNHGWHGLTRIAERKVKFRILKVESWVLNCKEVK